MSSRNGACLLQPFLKMAPKAKAVVAKAKAKAKAAPKAVRRARGGLPALAAARQQIVLDRWTEGGPSIAWHALLQPGMLLELVILSPGGRNHGHAAVEVTAVHPPDREGVFVEFVNRGGSTERLREWLEAAGSALEPALLHLCARPACHVSSGARPVLHVRRWRVRDPGRPLEGWMRPAAPVAQPQIPMGGPDHGLPQLPATAPVGGADAAILQQVGEMRAQREAGDSDPGLAAQVDLFLKEQEKEVRR
eukprot:509965-Amphidinium_carterae.1